MKELVDERDREISGIKLELRTVKNQLDKCDIEVVELNNIIEELQRGKASKSPNRSLNKDLSMRLKSEEVSQLSFMDVDVLTVGRRL